MNTKRHKNQMVITALALMIAVAGYLNFSGKDLSLLSETMTKEQAKSEEKDEVALAELGDDDMLVEVDDTEVTTQQDVSQAEDANGGESLETAAKETDSDKEFSAVDDLEISEKVDDEIEDTVSVSASSVANSIMQAQLTKEQNRSKNKEMLMEIVNSADATAKQKEDAANQILQLSEFMEKEAATQEVLAAKGYKDCMVSMSEESVDVAVNAETLSDVDRAKIEDVVQRKTGMQMQNIVISTYTE